MLCRFSRVRLCTTLWTVAHQAPLSMGFSNPEYWSELPCPSPGDLPDPSIEPASLKSSALADGFFTTSATWEGASDGKDSACNAGDMGSIPGSGRPPGEGNGNLLQ